MNYPFDASPAELQAKMDAYVASVFSCLVSEFLELPKGAGFIDYPTFEHGYEELKRATNSFAVVDTDLILPVVQSTPISLIVIRAILGFTPPEWACLATQRTGVNVPQGAARSIDRKIRLAPESPLKITELTEARLRAMLDTASQLLTEGSPKTDDTVIHRLHKADTRGGLDSVKSLSQLGAPYAMLLYGPSHKKRNIDVG